MMQLVIDASNIKAGGGLTHLTEILSYGRPDDAGFSSVIVCAPSKTLAVIPDKPWIKKHEHPFLNRGYLARLYWRRCELKTILKAHGAFLFVPGTSRPPFKWPFVTMCQNLLPIELRELGRYGWTMSTMRLLILRVIHFRSYVMATGVIFLTKYCYHRLPPRVRNRIANVSVVPHGINRSIFAKRVNYVREPRDKKFNLLYVSIIDLYKHQDKLADAVIRLNREGYDVKLTLVGPFNKIAIKRFNRVVELAENQRHCIDYVGMVAHETLSEYYENCDAFIFASSCESFGMILTEAMAMGLPILCSNRSSLPETLGDAGLYFDPEDVESIKSCIIAIRNNNELRRSLGAKAFQRSQQYDWKLSAEKTFSFIAQAAKESGL